MTKRRHPKKEVREALEEIEAEGWVIEERSGHAWGVMMCPYGCCWTSIYSTPRNAEHHARSLRRAAKRCQGGHDEEGDTDG